MTINVSKLTQELQSAGIATAGCNSNGVIWGADGTTEIQDLPEVVAIVNAHNPDSPLWSEVRAKRDALLAECDWTQVADAPLSANQKELWSAYRQLLRDLPQRFTDTADVVYPQKPEA